jgi:hypothetical protein
MQFVFMIIGIVFVIAGVRGKADTPNGLIPLLHDDLIGKDNYIYWALSIIVVGAIGYSDDLKPISRSFMVLIIITLVLSNGGVFSKLNNELFGKSN